MDTATLVSNVYLKAEGKLPTFASGSTKWTKIVAIANQKIDTWQNEALWNSLFVPNLELGRISATDTYDLDDSINQLDNADTAVVRIVHVDGNFTDYKTVPAKRLKDYQDGQYCARVGRTLVFCRPFTVDDKQFGGMLSVQAYIYPDHLVNDTDIVPVDDPAWLVTASAAEYNRTDITKKDQYATLVNESNSLMDSMKRENDSANLSTVARPWRPYTISW